MSESPTRPALPRLSPAERRVRLWELLLLLGVCFGKDIAYSVYTLQTDPFQLHAHAERTAFVEITLIVDEIAQLGLLAYILYRQARRFRDIGFRWRWSDPLIAIPLYLVAFLARHFFQLYAAHQLNQPFPYQLGVHDYLRSASYNYWYDRHIGPAYADAVITAALLNPFAEELIVRAYLMTEVKAMTGSAIAAVLASTLFQTAYHFYEGVLPPLGHMAMFLVFAIWFACSKRIMPVILAHMIADLTQVV